MRRRGARASPGFLPSARMPWRRGPMAAGVPIPRRCALALFLGATALIGVACSGTGSAASADPNKDKLAQVQTRGTLVGYAELDYPPQSIRNEGVARATTTKCLPNQITAQEVTGFDIETT